MKSRSIITAIFLGIIILGLFPINGQNKELFNLSNDEITLLPNNRTKNEKNNQTLILIVATIQSRHYLNFSKIKSVKSFKRTAKQHFSYLIYQNAYCN